MKKSRWMLAILGLLALAGPVAAQDKGLYLGGSVGHAEYADTCDDVSGFAAGCRDHDTAWRVFAGYRFNRTVSAELGFAHLGNVTAVGTFGGAPLVVDAETRTFDLSAIMSIPVANRLSALVRLGGYRAKTTLEVAGARSGESNSGFTYGAGLGFDLGFLGLRAEWQRYDNVGGGTTGEDTIDLFSLGALFRF